MKKNIVMLVASIEAAIHVLSMITLYVLAKTNLLSAIIIAVVYIIIKVVFLLGLYKIMKINNKNIPFGIAYLIFAGGLAGAILYFIWIKCSKEEIN